MRISLILLLMLFSSTCSPSFSQEIVNPGIKSTGGIYALENLDKKPDPSIEYRIVVDLRSGPSSPSEINPALHNLARMINLHLEGGIDPDNLKVVGVMHALATPATQSDNGYQQKFDSDNPNTALIQELSEKGVELFVCGQSLVAREYGFDFVNPNIDVSISALTILTEYTQKGYTLLVF